MSLYIKQDNTIYLSNILDGIPHLKTDKNGNRYFYFYDRYKKGFINKPRIELDINNISQTLRTAGYNVKSIYDLNYYLPPNLKILDEISYGQFLCNDRTIITNEYFDTDVKLSEKQKDYEVLTIDEFQNKCQFHYIIDEISYNTYLLKNGMVININQINSGIKLLTIILNELSEYKIRTLITKFDFDWYNQYNDYNKTQSNCIQTQDHLGNIFKSKREMAKHYSINPSTLDDRLKKQNWSLEKALTAKPSSKHQKHKAIDHLNIEYKSIKELCDTYNITVDTYYIRQYRGWSLKDTLTKPVIKQQYQPKTMIDHNGNKFSSQNEMLQYYNIHKNTYQNRINRGWSLEKALTTPPLKQK